MYFFSNMTQHPIPYKFPQIWGSPYWWSYNIHYNFHWTIAYDKYGSGHPSSVYMIICLNNIILAVWSLLIMVHYGLLLNLQHFVMCVYCICTNIVFRGSMNGRLSKHCKSQEIFSHEKTQNAFFNPFISINPSYSHLCHQGPGWTCVFLVFIFLTSKHKRKWPLCTPCPKWYCYKK
jgi:hypothetical protein